MAESGSPNYISSGPRPMGYTEAVPSTITSIKAPMPAPPPTAPTMEAYPQMTSNTPTRVAALGANDYVVGRPKAYEGPILVDERNVGAPQNMKAYEGPIYVDNRNRVLGPTELKDRLLVGAGQNFNEERTGAQDLQDGYFQASEERGHFGGAFDAGWAIGHKGVADRVYDTLGTVGSAVYYGVSGVGELTVKPVGYGIAGGVGLLGLGVGKAAAFGAGTVSGLGYGLGKPVVSVAHEHVVQPLGYGASAAANYTVDKVSGGVSTVGGAVVDGASALGERVYSVGEATVDGAANGMNYAISGIQPSYAKGSAVSYANQPRAFTGSPGAYPTVGAPTVLRGGPSVGTSGAPASRGRYIEPTRSYVDRPQAVAVGSYRT